MGKAIASPERMNMPIRTHAMYDLAFFGHYIHVHRGGRSGKQAVLMTLYKRGPELTQRELSDSFCITPAALSEVLTKLENEGFVTRDRDKRDRRRIFLQLTESGIEQAKAWCNRKDDFEDDAFSCFSDEELDDFVKKLDTLVEHWMGIQERGVFE